MQLAALNADLPETAGHLKAAVYGLVPFSISLEDRETDVRLRCDEAECGSRIGIMNLELPNKDNAKILTGSVSSLTEERSIPFLLREDRKDIGNNSASKRE